MPVMTVREALNAALREEMARDHSVFLMGEEVGHYNGAYKVSQGLLDQFGEHRVVDTPIAEGGFAGIAVGAAMAGLRPVIEFMTWNFSLVAIDQIVNNAAKLRYMSGGQFRMPIVYRGPQGAGGALAAQHSQIFESYYAYVPGLLVIAPSNAADMKGLLKSAIRNDDVVIFLESERMYNQTGEVPEGEFTIPIGQATIAQEGSDITLISWGFQMGETLKAAASLSEKGVFARVIDLRTLVPLDFALVRDSVALTHRVVIIQEAWERCSYGAWLAQKISRDCFDDLDHPVELLSAKDVPMPYAFNLEEIVLPNSGEITDLALRMVKG